MWLILLYGLAAIWALRTLLKLMDRHKQIHLHELQRKLEQQQSEQDIFDAIDKKNQELEQERQSESRSRAA
ncbi:MAG: hypothetical protein R3C12_01730 [Planctomycetaceae bacterium]|nr:hypothetical protein [Planctomycetaceae bacterium]